LDNNDGHTTTVLPPVYVQQFTDGYGFGIFPLVFYRQRADAWRLTLLPLFHYSSGTDGSRFFVSPVAWYRRRPDSRMGGVLLYHWSRRTDSSFDGLIPFYLSGRNTRLGSRWQYVFPIVYSGSDPVRRRTVVFPVVWDWETRHRRRTTAVLPLYLRYQNIAENSSTTWVAPTFQFSRSPDHWTFNIHPLLYLSSGQERSHQVVFPIFWRFDRPNSTSTVVAPIWWDFQRPNRRFSVFFPFVWRQQTPNRTWTAVMNVVYTSGERHGIPYWSFQFWPLFRLARPSPEDIEWDVLLGLFGYGRRGERHWVDVFWVPVEYRSRADTGDTVAITSETEQPF